MKRSLSSVSTEALLASAIIGLLLQHMFITKWSVLTNHNHTSLRLSNSPQHWHLKVDPLLSCLWQKYSTFKIWTYEVRHRSRQSNIWLNTKRVAEWLPGSYCTCYPLTRQQPPNYFFTLNAQVWAWTQSSHLTLSIRQKKKKSVFLKMKSFQIK